MQRAESFKNTLIQERLRAWGEGDDRGWDGWMASQTQWTWVWVNSGSWWWTGRPSILQSMGSQKDTTEWLNWDLRGEKYILCLNVDDEAEGCWPPFFNKGTDSQWSCYHWSEETEISSLFKWTFYLGTPKWYKLPFDFSDQIPFFLFISWKFF